MEQNKVTKIAELVKAAAAGFIGGSFAGYGITYFAPQAEYYVPRILLPLFNALGHVGLAVGMLLLGAALVLFALSRWRKYGGKSGVFAAIVGAAFAVILTIGLLSSLPKKPVTEQELMEQQLAQRDKNIEEIMQVQRPKFESAAINAFLDEYESMLADYRRHAADNDSVAMKADNDREMDIHSQLIEPIKLLSAHDTYLLSQYLAKLQIEWHEVTNPSVLNKK